MLEHTIIQYFLSSFLWTFCKPLLFTVTVNFLQTQDFKKEQKQKNSFAFHSQVWATRSHSWKKSWGSRCLKKTEEIQPWHDSEKNFSPVRNTRCLLWMKESQHSTEIHGAKVWSHRDSVSLLYLIWIFYRNWTSTFFRSALQIMSGHSLWCIMTAYLYRL